MTQQTQHNIIKKNFFKIIVSIQSKNFCETWEITYKLDPVKAIENSKVFLKFKHLKVIENYSPISSRTDNKNKILDEELW